MHTALLLQFGDLMIGVLKIDQEMQGFGATELLMNSHENDDLRSAKIEREAVDSLLIESVFHDKKPECVTHAKRFAEASKLIVCYNFESPDRASAFLDGELGETPLEFVFHHKRPECVTYAKRSAEASKLILLCYNVESPDRASAFLDGELGETPLESVFQDTKPECLTHAKRFMEASKLILLCGEGATPLVDESSKSAPQTAVLLKKCFRTDFASALLRGEIGATPLEEFDESEKSALQTALEVLLQNDDRTDRMDVIWAQHDYTIEGLLAVALSGCTENKVLVLAVAEYVHYNAETIDLISSQDKLFMLLKKTSVSHSANQHKCPACSQGREIFSGSCNALLIVTDGDTVTERTLWLIKQCARLCQKNKMGITYLVMITMLGWIPGVKAAEKNASALVQGSTTTSTVVCVIIGTVASLYFSCKILKWFRLAPPGLPPPVFPPTYWILFSRKVRIWTEGYMEFAEMCFKLFDEEDKCVGSWKCPFVTDYGDIVDMVSWGTLLFNMMLHIFVEQEGGVQEISFNEMDHPDFSNTAKDVYINNPDTGLLHYIGRSPARNFLPGEREILRRRIWHAQADATRW